MKRLFCLLLAMMALISVASAEEWCSIVDIHAQTPASWTQTYETEWCAIMVDAEIHVSEVDKVPVMLVESGADTALPTAEKSGWDDVTATTGNSLRWNNPWSDDHLPLRPPQSMGFCNER